MSTFSSFWDRELPTHLLSVAKAEHGWSDSTGALRASHHVSYNKEKSTINEPFYDHVREICIVQFDPCFWLSTSYQDRREPIAPGTIVPLTIGIWPTGMTLDAGESLVLRIAGHSLVLPEVSCSIPLQMDSDTHSNFCSCNHQFKIMAFSEPIDHNIGRHIVHSGGRYDSHLILPIIN